MISFRSSPPADDSAAGQREVRGSPLWTFLALLLLMLAIGGLAGEAPFQGTDYLAMFGPIGLAVACLWTAYRLLVTDSLNLWMPMPTFLIACAFYYGIGPLIYTFGTAAAIAELNVLWPVTPDELRRTHLLNLCGILVITGTFLFASRMVSRAKRSSVPAVPPQWGPASVQTACLIFLAIGLPVKYLLVLPYVFGMTSTPVPSVVAVLGSLDFLGILLLSYLATRFGKGWLVGFLVLLTVELAVELVSFNKHRLLLMLSMVLLGRYMVRRSLGEFAFSGGILFVVYLLISPFVGMGRKEIMRRRGNHFEAPLRERFEISRDILASWGSAERETTDSEQGWWQRFSYAHAQAFAMYSYDAGSPGDSFEMLAYVLIPRLIYPEKPITSNAGYDFSELAYGHRFSSTGIGVFGEAYWNGGWPMVGLASVCIGLLFAVLAALARQVMGGERWPFFIPCVFFGIQFGYRIDGWFVSDYIGQVPIFLAMFLLSCLLAVVFRPVVGDDRSLRGRLNLS